MARYPCAADGKRYGGKQSTVYISAYTHDGKSAWQLRLCAQHFADVWAILAPCTTDWLEPDEDEPICCPVCRRLDADGYLVATFFAGEAPEKRAGCVCGEHAHDLLKTLQVSPELAVDRSEVLQEGSSL